MKKKRAWDAGRAFSLAEDIVGPYCRCHELKCSAICFQFQTELTFISANITEERYPLYDCPIVFSLAIISMRLYPCDTAFAAYNITRVSKSSWLHGLSGYSDTSAPSTGLPNTFASRVDFTSYFLHRIRSEQWPLADNITIPPCCLSSAQDSPIHLHPELILHHISFTE